MADDLKVESTAPAPEREVLWVIVFLALLNLPLAWRKIQGGDEISWIGYAVRCSDLSLGISLQRATWAANWLRQHSRDGMGCIEEFASVFGRLAFICGALEYDRPFLAPLFAYKAKQGERGFKVYPMIVRLIMSHLAARLSQRRYYPSAATRHRGEAFRVDAKAEGAVVGVGGWLPTRNASGALDTMLSPWFSLSLTAEDAPWAFHRGAPYRAIASLEALATLIGVMVFTQKFNKRTDATITLSGYTDNRGNKFALTRLQTAKFPLCLLIMELAAQLEANGSRLDMSWAPREANQEADRLADGLTMGFDPDLRIPFSMVKASWLVLPSLLQEGLVFDAHRRRLHAERHANNKPTTRRRKKPGLRITQPW